MRDLLLLCWRDSEHPQGGGSERYLERVGAELAQQGHAVTLRTARYPGSAKAELRDGIRISRAGGRLTVYPRALAAIALGRLGIGSLAGLRPDAVIDTQNGIPFFARLVTRAPVTVLVHHGHREQWPVAGRIAGRIGWLIESRIAPRLHRANQYLTVSLPSAEELVQLGVTSDRIAVVHNGCDEIPAAAPVGGIGTRAPQPRLVVLSRLVPHKQIEDALAAVAQLRKDFPAIHLDVVGSGWWDAQLRATATDLAVSDAVTFHGHVAEQRKHEILAGAWVHVMPSRKEGWGLTVVEAAQHGVPTVGYRSSRGLTASVVDGVTGVLVEDHHALATAIGELLADDGARESMGHKARTRSAEFSWTATGRGVGAVLAATVAGRRSSGIINAPAAALGEPARTR